MTEFQGIPIDEGILSDTLTFYSILLPVALCIFITLFLLWKRFCKESPEDVKAREKQDEFIRHLQSLPSQDTSAKRRLAEELAQRDNENEEWHKNRIFSIVICAVAIFLILLGYFCAWLPCYQDTVHKDYSVYTGVFTVEHTGGRFGGRWLALQNGTSLGIEGSAKDAVPDEEGTYTGTIVYAPRSELVLGIEWEDVS